jgi:hypothetical protein
VYRDVLMGGFYFTTLGERVWFDNYTAHLLYS